MTRRRWIGWLAGALAVVAALAYLHDPPWMEGVTSGLRPWEQDPPGTLFRWTMGRATFYVPANVSTMTVPMRSMFPGPNDAPVQVELRDDGRLLGTVELARTDVWVRQTLPLKPYAGKRRVRRIDLRVSRVVQPFNLGVMTGEVVLR